jgi:hypothetical protein
VTVGLPEADVAGGGVVPGASTVQAWRVGEERAETYLRLLAEAYLRLLAEVELGRAGDQLRGLDAAAGTDGWSDPGMEHATAERALWKVIRAGRILATAGVLDHETHGMAAEPVVTAVGQVPADIPPWPIT